MDSKRKLRERKPTTFLFSALFFLAEQRNKIKSSERCVHVSMQQKKSNPRLCPSLWWRHRHLQTASDIPRPPPLFLSSFRFGRAHPRLPRQTNGDSQDSRSSSVTGPLRILLSNHSRVTSQASSTASRRLVEVSRTRSVSKIPQVLCGVPATGKQINYNLLVMVKKFWVWRPRDVLWKQRNKSLSDRSVFIKRSYLSRHGPPLLPGGVMSDKGTFEKSVCREKHWAISHRWTSCKVTASIPVRSGNVISGRAAERRFAKAANTIRDEMSQCAWRLSRPSFGGKVSLTVMKQDPPLFGAPVLCWPAHTHNYKAGVMWFR